MRADLAALLLTALCVVAITVLAVVGAPIPDVLSMVTAVSVGGAAGAAVPKRATTRSTS